MLWLARRVHETRYIACEEEKILIIFSVLKYFGFNHVLATTIIPFIKGFMDEIGKILQKYKPYKKYIITIFIGDTKITKGLSIHKR